MARWAGDVNRIQESHASTQKDNAAVTAGRLQNQAAKKLEMSEWKRNTKNRMQTAEATKDKAVADAGVAMFENDNKEEALAAEQQAAKEKQRGEKLDSDKKKFDLDQDKAFDSKERKSKINLDASTAEKNRAAIADGLVDPNAPPNNKDARKTSNKIYQGMIEDTSSNGQAIDIARGQLNLYAAGAKSGNFQDFRNAAAKAAVDLGFADKMPPWVMGQGELPTQEVIANFHKRFLGSLILAGGKGISNSDAKVLEEGLANTGNTEEANKIISVYQAHQAEMSNDINRGFGRRIQMEDKTHAQALQEHHDTYGKDFTSIKFGLDGKLRTFTDFRRSYVEDEREHERKGTIEDHEVAVAWSQLHFPNSEILQRK
tara:strand:+ start:22491 stop:23606 length:1116 start_codon:yes stop_codon:yes gene_type:complete